MVGVGVETSVQVDDVGVNDKVGNGGGEVGEGDLDPGGGELIVVTEEHSRNGPVMVRAVNHLAESGEELGGVL